jgi:hypothetical protein
MIFGTNWIIWINSNQFGKNGKIKRPHGAILSPRPTRTAGRGHTDPTHRALPRRGCRRGRGTPARGETVRASPTRVTRRRKVGRNHLMASRREIGTEVAGKRGLTGAVAWHAAMRSGRRRRQCPCSQISAKGSWEWGEHEAQLQRQRKWLGVGAHRSRAASMAAARSAASALRAWNLDSEQREEVRDRPLHRIGLGSGTRGTSPAALLRRRVAAAFLLKGKGKGRGRRVRLLPLYARWRRRGSGWVAPWRPTGRDGMA